MTKQVLLESKEDLQWLKDVHCKDLPDTITVVLLEGNEDAPDKVQGWIENAWDNDPDYVKQF